MNPNDVFMDPLPTDAPLQGSLRDRALFCGLAREALLFGKAVNTLEFEYDDGDERLHYAVFSNEELEGCDFVFLMRPSERSEMRVLIGALGLTGEQIGTLRQAVYGGWYDDQLPLSLVAATSVLNRLLWATENRHNYIEICETDITDTSMG